MIFFRRKVRDDRLQLARWDELSRRVLVAVYGGAAGVVEPPVVERHVSAAVSRAELFGDVRPTVAVAVAQREDLSELALRVDISVRGNSETAELLGVIGNLAIDDEVVGNHQRAEPWRQEDRSVIGIRGGQRGGTNTHEQHRTDSES